MKISITLDIPAAGVEAWADEYGLEPREVRDDIRQHVKSTLQAEFGAELTGWEVR